MENKINIAELLKDCPSGMELNCTMYEDVCFDYVDELNIIHCYIQHEAHKTSITFNQHGTPNSDIKSKCVIFPKGKTTWEGFQRPFKDGDILTVENESNPFIFYCDCDGFYNVHCALLDDDFISFTTPNKWTSNHRKYRFATEEEKAKLFQVIKDNGYKWNEATKKLEKLIEPKFKVGDRVKHISAYTSGIVVKVDDKCYHIDYPKGEGVCYISSTLEKDYELVPNKFDITTLKVFDKVLVRDSNKGMWSASIFSHIWENRYICIGVWYNQCIPYEGNEHLLGITNDCDDFYKTWE